MKNGEIVGVETAEDNLREIAKRQPYGLAARVLREPSMLDGWCLVMASGAIVEGTYCTSLVSARTLASDRQANGQAFTGEHVARLCCVFGHPDQALLRESV